MAIAAAHCLDEDEEEMIAALRELVEDGADDTRGLGEDLRALRSKAAALEDAGALTPESWDWAENVERVARRAAETMAEQEGDIVQRALPLLSRRPGEEAFVAALRRQAATAGAREKDLRRRSTSCTPPRRGSWATSPARRTRRWSRATSRRPTIWPWPPWWRTRPCGWRRG